MSARLYIEGAESKEDQIRCREGFRRLLEKLGFAQQRRMPRLIASGSRSSAFSDFRTALANAKTGHFIAMLIDSEEPVANIEETWAHLRARDNWERPLGTSDEQVLLMTTCMETWIVADREMLRKYYGHKLHEAGLPPGDNLEGRSRIDILDRLKRATQECSNAYEKGRRAFAVIEELNPAALEALLPSFARIKRILTGKL